MKDHNDLNNPLDVTSEKRKGEYPWTQADRTPGIDAEAEFEGSKAAEESEYEKHLRTLSPIEYERLTLGSFVLETEKAKAVENERLQAEKKLRKLYPRAFKLMDKGKYFLVVAFDEPYFLKVYSMIREQEIKIGRWNEEDEKVYQFFQKDDE